MFCRKTSAKPPLSLKNQHLLLQERTNGDDPEDATERWDKKDTAKQDHIVFFFHHQ